MQWYFTSHHNHPQYVIAKVRDVAQEDHVDQGSSLSIISLSVLDAVYTPRENIMRQPIKVSGFRGDCTYTIGFMNLDPTVGLIRAAHLSHVINAQMAYHLLLRMTLGSLLQGHSLHVPPMF